MSILKVGAGQHYTTIASAVAAARNGDTVQVQAGTYTNDFATIRTAITLQAVGGMVYMVATVPPPNGKAILTVDANATIDHFSFSGAAVHDGNGAGIRYEAGNLVIKNSLFIDNQEGLLAAANAKGTILIQNSEFNHNGAGDGYTHNLYVGAIARLTIQNSYFHDAVVGHEIKSRARVTVITGSRIQDNAAGTASYSVDLPNGGVAVIQGNVIEKGPLSQNNSFIHFGGDRTVYRASSLRVGGNTIVNDKGNATLVYNQTTRTASITGNHLFALPASRIVSGHAVVSGNTVLAARPALNTAPVVVPPPRVAIVPVVPVVPGPVAPPTPPAPPRAVAPPVEFGRAGAVIATGHILTVGHGMQYASLHAALAASVDGDTIRVNAGTYTNDYSEITKKVVIEGVGGMAHFVATAGTPPPNGKAQLVIDTDVTIRNLEFSGTVVHDRNGAGIRYQGGNLTIVNSYFHDNQEGLLTTPGTGTIGIYDSEFARNGLGDGYTHNIYAGRIGTLVIRNSYIHDARVGHEVKSLADNTILDGNRITQATGTGSYDVDLPYGGAAVLTNNLIEKGAHAQNPNTIHYSGDGPTYPGSSLTATGNTFVNDNSRGYLLFNAGGAPATLAGNSTYNFASTALAYGPATITDTTLLATKPPLTGSAGYHAAGTPPAPIPVPVPVPVPVPEGDLRWTA